MKVKEPQVPEITEEILSEVIDLARLDPLSAGMALYRQHIISMLGHFKVLATVDLEGVEPTVQVNQAVLALREDEVITWFSRDEAMENSRMRSNEYFRAPVVLEEG